MHVVAYGVTYGVTYGVFGGMFGATLGRRVGIASQNMSQTTLTDMTKSA